MGPWRDSRLLEWSLGTFHTGFFFTILVTLLYVTGALGSLLAGLNTAVGLAAFALLWLTTWWCTRRALRGMGGNTWEGRVNFRATLYRAMVWGGINGLLFLIGPLAIFILFSILSLAVGNIPNLPFLLLAILIGSIIAFGVGLLTGLVLGLIDSVLFKISRRIVQRLHVPHDR